MVNHGPPTPVFRRYLTRDQFHPQMQTAIAQADPLMVSGLASPELVAALTQR